jgi:hypothetical protein
MGTVKPTPVKGHVDGRMGAMGAAGELTRLRAVSGTFDLFGTLGYAPPAPDGIAVLGASGPVAASPMSSA